MSFFLDQILGKRGRLKNTETVVTCVDGSRYLQSGDSRLKLDDSSHGFVVDTKPDDVPALIIDHLYLGAQDCCEQSVLTKYSIRHVLSVGVPAPTRTDGVSYKFIECLDLPETNLRAVIDGCLDFIDDSIGKKFNLLVHCNAGVSRSPSVIIGYLILRHGMSYSCAYDSVKLVRVCVRPNDGFQVQLRALR